MSTNFYFEKKTEIIDLGSHEGAVYTAKYSPEGEYVLSTGVDSTLKLWNASTATEVAVFKTVHNRDVLDVEFCSDNGRFVSCGAERHISLTDTVKQTVIRRFEGHYERVNSVAIGAEDSIVISGGYDKRVHLWDLRGANRGPIQTFREAKDSVTRVQCRGTKIYSSSVDGTVRIYDIRTGRMTSDSLNTPITGLDLSFNQKYLIGSTTDSQIHFWGVEEDKLIKTFEGKHKIRKYPVWVRFSRESDCIISGSDTGELVIYDLADSQKDTVIPLHEGTLASVDFNKLDDSIVTAGFDGKIKVCKFI